MLGDCRFQNSWLMELSLEGWLKLGKHPSSAYCTLCMKDFSIKGRGVHQVRVHQNGKYHIDAVKAQSKQSNALSQFVTPKSKLVPKLPPGKVSSIVQSAVSLTFPESCKPSQSTAMQPPILAPPTLRDSVTRAEILFAFKLVDSHTPLNFCLNLNELLKTAFPDSEIVEAFKLSNDKAAYLINHGLAPYFERINSQIIQSSDFFVAQFDESLNKVSQRGQLDLHVRYMDSENLVQTRYISSAFLGKATAEDLMKVLKECFPNEMALEKVIQLSMDGLAVNWKLFQIFKDELAEKTDSKVIDIGSCGIHVDHGALKSGFQASN